MTENVQNPGTARAWWISALALTAVAIAVAAIISITAETTRQRIARNEAAQAMNVLRSVLPDGSYDNHPDQDRIQVLAPELLGSDEPLPVYRARQHGQPVAVVMTTVARQGFVGPIRLLVSLTADGKIVAVRAVTHQETPGLGDRIEATRSDWIRRFSGRSLIDPDTSRWMVRPDGGDFDQLTGATITSRAVVNAVRDAALYYREHQTEIFELPAA